MGTQEATQSSSGDKSRIQSITKMRDILGCFSTVDRHLTLAQIAARSTLPRPTAHRMLAALREIGFVDQDVHSGSYSLGIGLFELGSLALSNMDLLREGKPFLDKLSRLAGESAHLGVFNGYEVIVIEREEPGDRPARALQPNEASPAYCTGVGKAALAFQPPAVIERVIEGGLKPYTNSTITAPDKLRAELAAIRDRGYATDDCEHELWVRCVAAPIRNSAGQVFAAVSVTGPADRMTDKKLADLAPLTVQTADSISRQIGFRSRA